MIKVSFYKMHYFSFLPTIDYYEGTVWLGWMNWAIEIGKGSFSDFDEV